ncbi:hypothetical protein [Corallococcus sp. EGB]|uniref:hypothetical protein n=1 Tax=Corallococcus sp. EGB TaxID=1521117 RepID=UPI001CBBCA8E|nr:hypothetical protein [Corallococcus sp. EGB]
MRCTRRLFPLLAVLPLLACGGSNGGVGGPCGTDGCESGLTCRKDFPGGFCAQGCTVEGEARGCAAYTLCTRQADTLMCSAVCELDAHCRQGYACNGVSNTPIKTCQAQLETAQ